MDEDNQQIDRDSQIEQLFQQGFNQGFSQGQNDKNIAIGNAVGAMQSGIKDSNMIHEQIDTEVLLEKLEHFYRGDYVGHDKEGNEMWVTPADKDLITLNDFGVATLMEIISKYIDKNTALSYYTEERINQILSDLGLEFVILLKCNHVKMGMDTYFKKTKFRMIIVTTLHMIESTYRKAIRAKTLEELNQSKILMQTEGLGNRIVLPSKKGFLSRIMSPGR